MSLSVEKTTQKSDENPNPKFKTAEPIDKRAPSKESLRKDQKPSKEPSKRGATPKMTKSKRKTTTKTPKKSREKSVESDEMPPTANSEKSSEKEKKKAKGLMKQKKKSLEKEEPPGAVKKPEKPAEPSTKPAATANGPSTELTTAQNGEKTTGKLSEDPNVKENDKNTNNKKKKKKMVLKRETNHIFHLRPGVNKAVEHARRQNFERELESFETGHFTYLTDPTRYRFRSVPPLELVIQYVFPSLLILAILLSSMAIYLLLTASTPSVLVYNELSEMTLTKYDNFAIVEDVDDYIQSADVLREVNCPGLVQGPYRPVEKHEMHFPFLNLNFGGKRKVKKAMKALTYRWMYQVDAVMNMNFECPPSVIIELEK